MNLFGKYAAVPVIAMAVAACGTEANTVDVSTHGTVSLAISPTLGDGTEITQVTVQLYVRDGSTWTPMGAPITDLTPNGTQWTSVLGGLPLNQTLGIRATATGTRGSETVTFETEIVEIVFSGTTASLHLLLQEQNTDPGLLNIAPVFVSVNTPGRTVRPNEPSQFTVHTFNADREDDGGPTVLSACFKPIDALDFICSGSDIGTSPSSGSGALEQFTVTWTPPGAGYHTIRLMARDARGASSMMVMEVPVGSSTGELEAHYSYNLAPVLHGILAEASFDAAQDLILIDSFVWWGTLTANAVDHDGDTLSYQWSMRDANDPDCPGAWLSGDDTRSPLFFHAPLLERDGDDGLCSIQVTVTDGRGGETTGWIDVAVKYSREDAPNIVVTHQETTVMEEGWTASFGVAALPDDCDYFGPDFNGWPWEWEYCWDDLDPENDDDYQMNWSWTLGGKALVEIDPSGNAVGFAANAQVGWVDYPQFYTSTFTWDASGTPAVQVPCEVAPVDGYGTTTLSVTATNANDSRLQATYSFTIRVAAALCE